MLFLSGAAAMEFGVNVDTKVDQANFNLEQFNNSDTTEFKLTVENVGSVGCQYRLAGNFYSDRVKMFYSGDRPMFPGTAQDISLTYTRENYTGNVTGELYLEYCNRREHLENRTFTVDNDPVENEISSEVLEVNRTGASVEINRTNGTLIPVEQPPLWRIGSTEIEDGEASVEYNPPIYREGENLSFIVNDEGENIGYTQVKLEKEETLMDRLAERRNEIALAGLAIVLLILNLYQSRRTILSKIKDLK
jgi:hypothetical protein